MRRFSFYDKEKNKSTTETLANVLASRKQSNVVNTGNVTPSQNNQQDNEAAKTAQGLMRFGKGLYNIYNQGKQNGYFNFGNNASSSVASNVGSNVASNVGSSAGSSGLSGGVSKFGGFGNFGGGAGANGGSTGGGMPWGAIAGVAKQGYNTFSGKDDADYSDTEQAVAYPLQGAAMGSSFGPWGALGGALYGLGYSFKDDIGLKDNNILTDLIFPIGMGDEHQGLIRL